MNGRESFDLYDVYGRPLGCTKAREEVHRDGDWHRSAHIWIMTSDGLLLFQRRAEDKETWPGVFDASVGGHYRAGEGPEGTLREAEEELGITIKAAELMALGQRRVQSRQTGIVDREIQDVYLLRRDLPLTAYRADPVEIDGLALIPADEAARLHAGEIARLEASFFPVGARTPTRRALTSADVVSGRGGYLRALARAVVAVLAGGAPQPVQPEDEHEGA